MLTKYCAIGALFATLCVSCAYGERPQQKREKATHIVTGTVRRVFSYESSRNTEYVIQLHLHGVERGTGQKKGEFMYVYAFQRKKDAPLEPSASGHTSIPKTGQRIKAWVNKARGTMEGVYPNWFDPAKKVSSTK